METERERPGGIAWDAVERWLVVLIALHSYAVGLFLLFATRWGAAFGGFGDVQPLFFARQAGIFHFVAASGYLLEYRRDRGVSLMLLAKGTAVVFLVVMSFVEPGAWSVPLSAAADAAMALTVLAVRGRTRTARGPSGAGGA